jgi:hypothetical protein
MTPSHESTGARVLCLAVRSTVVMPRSVETLDVQRRENILALAAHPEGDAPIVAVPLSDSEGEAEPSKLLSRGNAVPRARPHAHARRLAAARAQGLRARHLRSSSRARATSPPRSASAADRIRRALLRERVERALALVHELVRVDGRTRPSCRACCA